MATADAGGGGGGTDPVAASELPESLLPFAALLFARFPEVFLALGHPNLGKDFDTPPSPVSFAVIEETREYKLVQVVLGRKGASRAPRIPMHPPLAGVHSSILGGLGSMQQAASCIAPPSPSVSISVSSASRMRTKQVQESAQRDAPRSALSSPGSSFKDTGPACEAASFAPPPAACPTLAPSHRSAPAHPCLGEEDIAPASGFAMLEPGQYYNQVQMPNVLAQRAYAQPLPKEPCSPKGATAGIGAGWDQVVVGNSRSSAPRRGAPDGSNGAGWPEKAAPVEQHRPVQGLVGQQPGPSGGGSKGTFQGRYVEPQSPRTPGKYKPW
mmetsp:Transcript_17640/g.40844  ORF Transcript_17640/g.40844 Transcript_17640/m.40844 type:complete len:326 (-) Transcript_17640:22-999(-)